MTRQSSPAGIDRWFDDGGTDAARQAAGEVHDHARSATGAES
jgi:hypothetical protein